MQSKKMIGDKDFLTVDLRGIENNDYSRVITMAGELHGIKNLVVIQDYEPKSLINFLSLKGWTFKTQKLSKNKYQITFCYKRYQ